MSWSKKPYSSNVGGTVIHGTTVRTGSRGWMARSQKQRREWLRTTFGRPQSSQPSHGRSRATIEKIRGVIVQNGTPQWMREAAERRLRDMGLEVPRVGDDAALPPDTSDVPTVTMTLHEVAERYASEVRQFGPLGSMRALYHQVEAIARRDLISEEDVWARLDELVGVSDS